MTCTVLLPYRVAPHSLILAMVLSMLTQIDFPQGHLEIFSPLSIPELFQDLSGHQCSLPHAEIQNLCVVAGGLNGVSLTSTYAAFCLTYASETLESLFDCFTLQSSEYVHSCM